MPAFALACGLCGARSKTDAALGKHLVGEHADVLVDAYMLTVEEAA